MSSLRKDILAACIVLIALISQMFFGVVHATSIWIAAAGPIAQVEIGSTAHSFLQICSAGGLVTLEGEEESSGNLDPSVCPVCSSAAAAPMLEGSTPPLLSAGTECISLSVKQYDQIIAQSFEQVVFARGPPVLS